MIQPMTRRLLALLLVLCTALALVGCGEKQTVSHEERVVTDTTGRAVKLPVEVKSLAIVPIP